MGHQVGKSELAALIEGEGSRLLPAFKPSKVSHPVTEDLNPISGPEDHHPSASAAGILQLRSIHPDHDPERRLPQHTWTADAEIWGGASHRVV
jgi:hypothetical protein